MSDKIEVSVEDMATIVDYLQELQSSRDSDMMNSTCISPSYYEREQASLDELEEFTNRIAQL